MLKFTSQQFKKTAQPNWMDEIRDVDWGGEPDPRGIVNEDNLSDYLVDEVEKPPEEKPKGPTPPPERPGVLRDNIPPTEFEEALAIPTGPPELPEGIRPIEYKTARRLVYAGIDNLELISFEYTNRHGMYAGYRTVEPHYTFVARTTGNEVLVTYDVSPNVGGIRAFILGNIHPYGVRYKGFKFTPRGEIMRGVI